MTDLDDDQHILRYIGGSKIHGDHVEPAVFRLRPVDKDGLSVNWLEHLGKPTVQEAVRELCEVFAKKENGIRVAPTAKFGQLNVGEVKAAAAKAECITVTVVHTPQVDDPSHSSVRGYENFNEEDAVPEQIAKLLTANHLYPVK